MIACKIRNLCAQFQFDFCCLVLGSDVEKVGELVNQVHRKYCNIGCMAENFKRKSCIFLSIRAQEASGLNLQKGIFCNRFQCFSQRCCLNQEIYLAARPPQLVFLISKIKVFGLHLTPSKCCDNPVLSQKIFRFKNRFTETKLFFPPLLKSYTKHPFPSKSSHLT